MGKSFSSLWKEGGRKGKKGGRDKREGRRGGNEERWWTDNTWVDGWMDGWMGLQWLSWCMDVTGVWMDDWIGDGHTDGCVNNE
jgi:hypothetical protein